MSMSIQALRYRTTPFLNTECDAVVEVQSVTCCLMADIDSSPGEPAFFLHHNYIDRLWWQWQQVDLTDRLYQMGGNAINQTENSPGPMDYPFTTLDYSLYMFDLLPNITVEVMMNPQDGYLCYEYDY